MLKDLVWIKKHYGEKMMHLCRKLFPVLLEEKGKLPYILDKHFARSRNLAEDIIADDAIAQFKDYIYSFTDIKRSEYADRIDKSAVELLDDAGYILYPECQTEEDIQDFRKYWAEGEELCTFKGGRLNSCRVWFAVKKNVDEIKREDFPVPEREDLYGTSVISIQFSKDMNHYLSIKNRYNHSVANPDNTFYSDLNNIISGLADAFERDYGVRDKRKVRNSDFELDNYICVEGKHYHYNYEIENVYYCDGGVIIDNGEVIKLPEHQMLIDYFIVDFKEKTIKPYDEKNVLDSFGDTIGNIKKIFNNNGVLKILTDEGNEIEIGLSPRNEIISYKNTKLKSIDAPCLRFNREIAQLDLPELEYMAGGSFFWNEQIRELNLPSLKSMGCCFALNDKLTKIDLPELESMLYNCFSDAKQLTELNMPKIEYMGDRCFTYNEQLTELNLPSLNNMGNHCFSYNKEITQLDLPKLEYMGGSCFYDNRQIRELNLPLLKRMGRHCFFANKVLTKMDLPELESMGDECFAFCKLPREANLPKLEDLGGGCFYAADIEELSPQAIREDGEKENK